MLIAGVALAIAAAGCDNDGEDPKREATPNYPADSAAVPGTVADSTRQQSSPPDASGSTLPPTVTASPQNGMPGPDSMRRDSAGR